MTNHRTVRTLLCLALLGISVRPLLGSEIRLTDSPASAIEPHICSLGNGTGDLSVVWVDARDGTKRIYFTRVSSSGVKLLSDIPVSDGLAAASYPSCGVDSGGATHIIWDQADAMWYAKLSAAGGVLVSPFVEEVAPVDYPYIDVEPAGNVHVAWVDAGSPRRVKYRKLNSSGGALGSCTTQIYDTADSDNTTEYPFVLAPGSGNTYAFVSWHGDHPDFDNRLEITLAYPGCNNINGPYSQTNDIPLGRTSMVENQSIENAFLIFEGDTDTPLQHIYAIQGAGSYTQVDDGIGPAFHPTISAISNSQLFTVWEDGRYGRPWIFGQASDGTTGSAVGGNCALTDGRSAARRPSMARAGAATFAVVWDDDRHGDEEIYLAITGPSCAAFEAVDPNPGLVDGFDISTDPAVLADPGARQVAGLVADGVTPVLLRLPLPSSGLVTFELSDGTGGTEHVGTLSSPGGVENQLSLQRATDNVGGKFWAFAVLRAPTRFVRTSPEEPLQSRTILVQATFDPDSGAPQTFERAIDLRRPPVLLLHGLWGRSSSWGWDLMDDPRYTVYAHDYWQTSADSIAANVREARRGVAGALEKMRDQGYAATQVDAFGHSMGGLLLRRHRTSSFYAVDSNLGLGDLHTLTTVDTPHKGSPLADLLLALTGIHPLLKNLNMCATCGAVSDLRPESSEIMSLVEADVPAHAFVGKGGSDLLELGLLASAPRELRALYLVLKFAGVLPDGIFPPSLQHDFIVGRSSQEGDLGTGASQTSVFGFVSTSNLGVHILSVTREDQVSTRADELLNTPSDDPGTFAPAFPAAPVGMASPALALQAKDLSLVTAGGISITDPVDGASVSPGASLQVTVTPEGGFVPANVIVTSSMDAAEVDTAPYTVTLEVPADASGVITLEAAALDAGQNLAMSQEVRLFVDIPATLTGISLEPSRMFLFSPPDQTSLRVIGHFDDGIDRDVSSSAYGTMYRSKDRSVVSVNSEGEVRSRSQGVTAIRVRNGAHEAWAVVQVKPMAVLLQVDHQGLEWPAVTDAIGYDVIRGDVPLLRGTLGEYELAVAECLVNDTPQKSLDYTQEPLTGEVWFFLVRGVTPSISLSYDSYEYGSSSQVGLRDAEIELAAGSCP